MSDRREKAQILDAAGIARVITRIAHEIVERNKGVDELVLVGLRSRGVDLAHRIAVKLAEIEGTKVPVGALDITLYRDDLDRVETQPVVRRRIPFSSHRRCIVDDVHTGRSSRTAMAPDGSGGRGCSSVAVLVDRGHRDCRSGRLRRRMCRPPPEWCSVSDRGGRADRVVILEAAVLRAAPPPQDATAGSKEGNPHMSISQLARSIAESPTLRLNEEARLLREKGLPVIHLGGGEPKNKTPIAAILSAAAKLANGDVKYVPTDGIPSLKRAIIRYTEENYERVVASENVIVSSGAKQSVYNVLFSLLNPQDEVIVLAPYWVSYPEMIRMVYGVPVVVTPEDGRYQPRMADIQRAVSPATRAIIVNSPNNPSGLMCPEEFWRRSWNSARKGPLLILDDIYHKLVFDGRTPPNALRFSKRDLDSSKVVVINGSPSCTA
jgi:pyrimidine operon attenuation protein/uracil phosphoribosyltransferase